MFSGGDVVTGAATAIEAIAAGRKAAYAIDTYIRTGAAQPEPEQFNSRKDIFAKVTVKDLRKGVSTAAPRDADAAGGRARSGASPRWRRGTPRRT